MNQYEEADVKVQELEEKNRELQKYIRDTRRQDNAERAKKALKPVIVFLAVLAVVGTGWFSLKNMGKNQETPVTEGIVEENPLSAFELYKKRAKREKKAPDSKHSMHIFGYDVGEGYDYYSDYYMTEHEPEMTVSYDEDRLLAFCDNKCSIYDIDNNETVVGENILQVSVALHTDEIFYLTNEGELYRTDFYSNEKTLLANDVTAFAFWEDIPQASDYKGYRLAVAREFDKGGRIDIISDDGTVKQVCNGQLYPVRFYSETGLYVSDSTDYGTFYTLNLEEGIKTELYKDCIYVDNSRDSLLLKNRDGEYCHFLTDSKRVYINPGQADFKYDLAEYGELIYCLVSEGNVECRHSWNGRDEQLFTYDGGDAVSAEVNKYACFWVYTSSNKLFKAYKTDKNYDGFHLVYDDLAIRDDILLRNEVSDCYFINEDDELCCFNWGDNSYIVVAHDARNFVFNEKRPNTLYYENYDGKTYVIRIQWPIEIESENLNG